MSGDLVPTLVGATAITAVGCMVANMISKLPDYWYDPVNNYGRFSAEHTDKIDKILQDPRYGFISGGTVVSRNHTTPSRGKHYFYRFPLEERDSTWRPTHRYKRWRYMGLEKMLDRNNKDSKEEFYTFWYLSYNRDAYNLLFARVFCIDAKTVHVHSFDMATTEPKVVMKVVAAYKPKEHQVNPITWIYQKWLASEHKNTKAMISGPPGSGKTFIGKLLKKHFDSIGRESMLFDNFEPSMVGVNIETMALNRADGGLTVIIVINEIDEFYDKVFNEEPSFDPRIQYTKNKGTFNNMLDSFHEHTQTIIIFTTEKSPDEIYKNEKYRSFIRPGRVDYFITMTPTESKFKHNDFVYV